MSWCVETAEIPMCINRVDYYLFEFGIAVESDNVPVPYDGSNSTWGVDIRDGESRDSQKVGEFTVVTNDAVNGNYAIEVKDVTLSPGIYYSQLRETDATPHSKVWFRLVIEIV